MIDIVLIVVGLVIVGASYVISEKKENGLIQRKADEYVQVKDVWTEKEEKIVRERIDSIVEDRIERAINKADAELCRISNEKIISSNEFSDQVLEKISRNHEEVVFLYNMLNEKEKQIKNFMQEINVWQSNVERAMQRQEKEIPVMAVRASDKAAEKALTAVDMLERLARGENIPEEKKEVWKKQPAMTADNSTAIKTEASEAVSAPRTEQTSQTEENNLSQLREFAKLISEESKEGLSSEVFSEKEDSSNEVLEDFSGEANNNRNKEILDLYKEGKSILEISKAFDMGQGEVKLIINLFQGAKV